MEGALDTYAQPYDPDAPVVCFDEMPRQLLDHVLDPLPMEPGQPTREDYEYERKGTANLFLCFESHTGWRHVCVTRRRTKVDFAGQMKALVDEHFPHAPVIHVALDNLNTHTFASLYEAFPPEEAQRLRKRLAFHYTPKHGSWLNQAEIELSVLSRQCLKPTVAGSRDNEPGGGGLGGATERSKNKDQRVVQGRRRSDEDEATLPSITLLWDHYSGATYRLFFR